MQLPRLTEASVVSDSCSRCMLHPRTPGCSHAQRERGGVAPAVGSLWHPGHSATETGHHWQ
eukprot:714543-Prymnesium_polylepis.2